MGAIISLPVSFVGTFVASTLGGCCSNIFSKSVSSIASSSLGTRLLYAIWLLFNSLISWISMSGNKSFLWPGRTCTDTGECGYFTVHRLNFALSLMHIMLAFILMNVKSTKDPRAALQNSWWSLKFIVYILLITFSFWLPNGFFIFFSKWVSVPAGSIFILVGLILLVDFAHQWAETCIYHVEMEDENSMFWQKFLVAGTALMYTASLAMTVVMYILFCHQDCNMNQSAVTINLLLALLATGVSIHPKIQEINPKSGLAQASMVSVYCSYLTMSAMASEPDDKMCNPLVRSSGTRNASIVLGALFTFIAIAYTTTRAAVNEGLYGSSPDGEIHLSDELEYEGLGGQTRSQLRYEAIKQAVEEGSLPESALYDVSWMEMPGRNNSSNGETNANDDEFRSTIYNYSLFHFIFFLACQWIAILLTINITQDDVGNFMPVGRTYFYSWVKIISAWICYGLYIWTVVAPVMMPDRFDIDEVY
ncbi:hypothetical protein Kpol_1052p38 [Vanderwaltozyma polyspora DSM 70294]|uniref:Membrane protein TMS1 n=1 Tax=Vanderwaltozyma polyspora (strain ATCC 22028 / DSM 70294 / BCRC 21397 / CBS 2163 / NBRC 10782 / NRRL Y-8283 / UCD 57-17) TaxID=436907 RepID=A7TM48_VANPO|nr:uncharacterized protein Kpol_1052p38 [Vanderwaltozyma polyspora DSM 70294]EDO16690.1 hypothetical protein Kpol_1052p38 [Vanderwaltozyma polyspora DSM 70294]